eukprot:gnl/MRDRNA2_/MRDRNA2_102971_c0_seq1.p1 gnl/MRDRNA2_/MRDRNA2_102971_c0~~gnl/MRDRNA2_/MRDRNA2_102971_c0_seq1.p1  ORF type:complete len:349 (-),score=89.91 gnl/MRDRNA2_/MRDRNA2_102971_c0_seq1:50-1096(-)
MPVSEAEAVGIIQRWYRSCMRRYRFLTVIRKAKRRREWIGERRKAAAQLHTHESELIEMKNLIHQPGGARLVNEWWDVRQGAAAEKLQSRWRAVRAKKEMLRLAEKEKKEKACCMLQAAVRRFRQRRRPAPIHRAADDDPASRPIDADRMRKHEEVILKKVRAYVPQMHPLLSPDELRLRSIDSYQAFLKGVTMRRLEARRLLLQKQDIRQKLESLGGLPSVSELQATSKTVSDARDGQGASEVLRLAEESSRKLMSRVPFGQGTREFLLEAEDKHKERKQILSRNMKFISKMGGSVKPSPAGEKAQKVQGIVVESPTEELEADALLKALEEDLGYDFAPAVNTWEVQ